MAASRATAGTPPRRTQAERTAASDSAMLRAALALIAKRGFRATSLEAIGKEAGYSRGLVSHRFGSKEGLLRELVNRMLDKWGAESRAPAVGKSIGIEALRKAAGAHQRAVEESPEALSALYMLMFESISEMPALREEFAALNRRSRDRIVRWIVEGIERGRVRATVDAEAQAALFLAALRGITMQWLVEPDAMDWKRVYSALEDWLQHGLSP